MTEPIQSELAKLQQVVKHLEKEVWDLKFVLIVAAFALMICFAVVTR